MNRKLALSILIGFVVTVILIRPETTSAAAPCVGQFPGPDMSVTATDANTGAVLGGWSASDPASNGVSFDGGTITVAPGTVVTFTGQATAFDFGSPSFMSYPSGTQSFLEGPLPVIRTATTATPGTFTWSIDVICQGGSQDPTYRSGYGQISVNMVFAPPPPPGPTPTPPGPTPTPGPGPTPTPGPTPGPTPLPTPTPPPPPLTANLIGSSKSIFQVNGNPYNPSLGLHDGDIVTFQMNVVNNGPGRARINYICDTPSSNFTNFRNLGGGHGNSINSTGCSGSPMLNVSGNLPRDGHWTLSFDATFNSIASGSIEVCSNVATINYNDPEANGKSQLVKFGPTFCRINPAAPDFNEVNP